ncbi:hypothetical protein CEXT_445691 [Caerostris extrusa]|uniref:Uncharacterized protein n=1 Tax=Caerostris extrusa TaxID=172846 RepID=A0AAV4N5P9_CAEEX|nr:hypothetical protein CEXT_445691 [Caerostris extrusa]
MSSARHSDIVIQPSCPPTPLLHWAHFILKLVHSGDLLPSIQQKAKRSKTDISISGLFLGPRDFPSAQRDVKTKILRRVRELETRAPLKKRKPLITPSFHSSQILTFIRPLIALPPFTKTPFRGWKKKEADNTCECFRVPFFMFHVGRGAVLCLLSIEKGWRKGGGGGERSVYPAVRDTPEEVLQLSCSVCLHLRVTFWLMDDADINMTSGMYVNIGGERIYCQVI